MAKREIQYDGIVKYDVDKVNTATRSILNKQNIDRLQDGIDASVDGINDVFDELGTAQGEINDINNQLEIIQNEITGIETDGGILFGDGSPVSTQATRAEDLIADAIPDISGLASTTYVDEQIEDIQEEIDNLVELSAQDTGSAEWAGVYTLTSTPVMMPTLGTTITQFADIENVEIIDNAGNVSFNRKADGTGAILIQTDVDYAGAETGNITVELIDADLTTVKGSITIPFKFILDEDGTTYIGGLVDGFIQQPFTIGETLIRASSDQPIAINTFKITDTVGTGLAAFADGVKVSEVQWKDKLDTTHTFTTDGHTWEVERNGYSGSTTSSGISETRVYLMRGQDIEGLDYDPGTGTSLPVNEMQLYWRTWQKEDLDTGIHLKAYVGLDNGDGTTSWKWPGANEPNCILVRAAADDLYAPIALMEEMKAEIQMLKEANNALVEHVNKMSSTPVETLEHKPTIEELLK